MGLLFTKLEELWASFQRDSCILILGLDNAGKTAVLYALKLEEPVEYTIPTLGFNLEEIKMGNVNIKMWDIGGQTKFRELWPHYFEQASGIAFVVDSNDIDRLELARDELHALVANKELAGKPFLVLGNKQDLPQAVGRDQLIHTLGFDSKLTMAYHCMLRSQELKAENWL